MSSCCELCWWWWAQIKNIETSLAIHVYLIIPWFSLFFGYNQVSTINSLASFDFQRSLGTVMSVPQICVLIVSLFFAGLVEANEQMVQANSLESADMFHEVNGKPTGAECHLRPVVHILQHPGCLPKPVASHACYGACFSYVQVLLSGSILPKIITTFVSAFRQQIWPDRAIVQLLPGSWWTRNDGHLDLSEAVRLEAPSGDQGAARVHVPTLQFGRSRPSATARDWKCLRRRSERLLIIGRENNSKERGKRIYSTRQTLNTVFFDTLTHII